MIKEQRSLMEAMWKISEAAWSVGWMKDMEFDLWKIVGEGPAKYGALPIDEALIHRLRQLSIEAQGWIFWDRVEQETWIGEAEWRRMYPAWLEAKSKAPVE